MTRDLLHRLLSYNPETGDLRWRVKVPGGLRTIGDNAGRIDREGYAQVSIKGRKYRTHRVIWFYVYGGWPIGQIDHINGDRADNRLANLREATQSQNQANRKLAVNNTSGSTGVTFHKKAGKWQAKYAGKYLGLFPTVEGAQARFLSAALEKSGDYVNLGGHR